MKTKAFLAFILMAGLAACGSEPKQKTEIKEEPEPQVESTKPQVVDVEQSFCDTFHVGTTTFDITLRRYPDSLQTMLVDVSNQNYYDNSVVISVKSNKQELFTKKVTKEIFKNHLPEDIWTSEPFWGMNFNPEHSSLQMFCFTAQVGWAGDGPAFFVFINKNGEVVKIEPDNSMIEIDYNPIP